MNFAAINAANARSRAAVAPRPPVGYHSSTTPHPQLPTIHRLRCYQGARGAGKVLNTGGAIVDTIDNGAKLYNYASEHIFHRNEASAPISGHGSEPGKEYHAHIFSPRELKSLPIEKTVYLIEEVGGKKRAFEAEIRVTSKYPRQVRAYTDDLIEEVPLEELEDEDNVLVDELKSADKLNLHETSSK